MIIDSVNIFDFKPHHINVRFVGEKHDVAYAVYYLAGNILDSDRNVVVSNYRKWDSIGGTIVHSTEILSLFSNDVKR